MDARLKGAIIGTISNFLLVIFFLIVASLFFLYFVTEEISNLAQDAGPKENGFSLSSFIAFGSILYMVFYILIYLVYLVSIYIAVRVYVNAEKEGSCSLNRCGQTSALMALFFVLIILFLYLFISNIFLIRYILLFQSSIIFLTIIVVYYVLGYVIGFLFFRRTVKTKSAKATKDFEVEKKHQKSGDNRWDERWSKKKKEEW